MNKVTNKLDQTSLALLPATDSLQRAILPSYDRDALGIGIVHLGLGAFHRSHQAIFTEQFLNAHGEGDWGICGVSFRNEALQAQMQQQDCLYTCATLDVQDRFQIVGAMKEVLVVKNQLADVLARMAAETTKIISLTVTEKGYCLTADGYLDENLPDIEHDIANPSSPCTAIGLLVEASRLRFNAGIQSFNVIACDNLPDNGEKLKSAVIQFSRKISPELARWIEHNTQFPNTMVDCITPKTEQATVELIEQALGVCDSAPVQRENFSQWVIESCSFDRPAWENVGVIFTDNVAVFEKAKLRVLNGLHSALAYIGSLKGYESVYQAVSDPTIKSFLVDLLEKEIIPTLEPIDGLNIEQYALDILTRFENPKIKHLLAQIACDGSMKIPVRILAPLAENVAQGLSTKGLSIVVAAWLHFLVNSVDNSIVINDPRANEFVAALKKGEGEPTDTVAALLSISGLIPETLSEDSAFIDNVSQAYINTMAFFQNSNERALSIYA
ncbi:mannitol dehydrogenase family protein [Thalassotalea sp. PLHSN55]|uniref:mannitol dehydrogenase family protein n=1 Tax=Thalassotalea sp. PLHSN55 TaxID=3435888 RepID=UPI003F85A3D5